MVYILLIPFFNINPKYWKNGEQQQIFKDSPQQFQDESIYADETSPGIYRRFENM